MSLRESYLVDRVEVKQRNRVAPVTAGRNKEHENQRKNGITNISCRFPVPGSRFVPQKAD
jgi:hypothetical protein